MTVFLFVIFIVLCGRFSLESCLLGLAATAAVFGFACAFMGHSVRREILLYRLLPFAFGYLGLLLWEILKAAFAVLGVLYRGQKVGDGTVVSFSSGFESDLVNTLLADSITLTPGTVTVHTEGDRFLVHALTPEMAEGMEDCVFVRRLRKLDRILKEERRTAEKQRIEKGKENRT